MNSRISARSSKGKPRKPSAVNLNALHTMQANKPNNTGPERALRRALRQAGLSGYRVNLAGVPGRPDVAFTKHKLAVFVHGCFWHRCPHCHPPTPRRHRAFWEAKFRATTLRDERTRDRLERLGWDSIELWECTVADSPAACATQVQRWLARALDRDET